MVFLSLLQKERKKTSCFLELVESQKWKKKKVFPGGIGVGAAAATTGAGAAAAGVIFAPNPPVELFSIFSTAND